MESPFLNNSANMLQVIPDANFNEIWYMHFDENTRFSIYETNE